MFKFLASLVACLFLFGAAAEAKTVNVKVEIVSGAPKGLRPNGGQHMLQGQACNGSGTVGRVQNASGGYDYYRCH